MSLGQTLEVLRGDRSIVAYTDAIGVHRSQWYDVMQGRRRLSIDVLDRVAGLAEQDSRAAADAEAWDDRGWALWVAACDGDEAVARLWLDWMHGGARRAVLEREVPPEPEIHGALRRMLAGTLAHLCATADLEPR